MSLKGLISFIVLPVHFTDWNSTKVRGHLKLNLSKDYKLWDQLLLSHFVGRSLTERIVRSTQ